MIRNKDEKAFLVSSGIALKLVFTLITLSFIDTVLSQSWN